MLKILLSNDDGIYAPGLNILAQRLEKFCELSVVAPDRNRSGASNSLTLDNPVRINQDERGYVMVEGTPTDCVHLAITGLLKTEPNMVISGINHGANLGDDVLYSGTVAAAMEGRFLGLPALAFSLVGGKKERFATAAYIAEEIIKYVIKNPLPADTILNVNIPDLDLDAIKGIEITRLGHRHKAEPVVESYDPRGNKIYWVGPPGKEQDAGKNTDFFAINNAMVSVTPLLVDLTKYDAINSLKDWAAGVSL